MHQDYYQIGTIYKAHGIRGDFSISLETDSPSRYKNLSLIYLDLNGTLKEYDVTKISIKDKERSAIIHLSGIEDMTTAENYIKCNLYLPLSNLPKLRGKKFYFHEIIGMNVIDAQLGNLGPISNVFELPQHTIAEVLYQGKQVLFPLIEIFIVKINREEKEFHTNLPEGILDVYLNDNGKDDDSE